MIGIVLVTHGRLGAEFIAAIEHVVGKQTQIAAVSIGGADEMEERRAEILANVQAVDTGEGVAVLTDMFGGTPSNLALSISEQAKVKILSGVNLPMLVKLVEMRGKENLAAIINLAAEAGRKYIIHTP
jgi:PTS system mannose-specific IIA component